MVVGGRLPRYIRPVEDVPVWSISQGFGVVSGAEPPGWRYMDMVAYGEDHPPGAVSGHFHNGVDYAVPVGSRLVAPGSGYVHAAGISVTGFGLRVVVASHGWLWLCGHLSAVGVTVGDFVTQGFVFGLSGGVPGSVEAGNSSGPHVHFSVMALGGLRGGVEWGPYANPVRFVFGGALQGW